MERYADCVSTDVVESVPWGVIKPKTISVQEQMIDLLQPQGMEEIEALQMLF